MRNLVLSLALLVVLSAAATTWSGAQLITDRRPVNWEETLEYPVVALNLGDEQDEAVRNSRVPVLLPTAFTAVPAHLQITAGSGWYAAAIDPDDGHVVFFTGTSLWTWPVDGDPPELPHLRRDEIRATRGEGIVEVDFSAFGAAYHVNVECYRPLTDQRCAEDDYILDLTENLVIAER